MGWVFKGLLRIILQYGHLIPTPVDRTSASDWLHKHLICQENKPVVYYARDAHAFSVNVSTLHVGWGRM